MFYQIRAGAFETNSSSAHSIVINASKDNLPPITKEEALEELKCIVKGEPVHDGILDLTHVYPEELRFGWGYDAFGDFGHKMFYALASCRYSGDDFADMEDFLKEFFDVKKIKYAHDEFAPGKRKLLIGEIDHQSQNILYRLSQGGVPIVDFLLNRKYFIIIDNDNG